MAAIPGNFFAVALCLACSPASAGNAAAPAAWSLASPKSETRATFAHGVGASTEVVVERRARGGWSVAWRGVLGGECAQGEALLADDGRLLVFSESTTDGAEAIVLHDAQGRIVRGLQLGQFLPAAYVQSLPRDTGGRHWRRGAKFAGAQDAVEFEVAAPGSAAGVAGPALRFSIDLRDGSVRTAQIREYLVAAERARTLVAGAAATPRAPGIGGKVAIAGVSTPATAIPR